MSKHSKSKQKVVKKVVKASKKPKAKVFAKAVKKVSVKVSPKKTHHISSSTIKNNVKISSAAQRIVQKVLDRTKRLEKEDKGIEAQLKQVLLNQKLMLQKEKEEITNQKKMLAEEDILLKEGAQEIKDDKEMEELEKKQAEELNKLEELEKEIEKNMEPHPLLKVGLHDVIRGSIGALAGVVIHYTFVYGVKVAEQLTMFRATMLFVLCFLVGFVFLYVTGFRKVQDRRVMFFMPVRLVILYLVSLAMSILVLWFFFPNFGYVYTESYKQVASVMLPALIGACTADLIGKE